MDIAAGILTVFSLVAVAGAASVWFARGRGNETIRLLELNVQSYKDAEKLKDQKIAYLEGQLLIKDETIKRLVADGTKTGKRS